MISLPYRLAVGRARTGPIAASTLPRYAVDSCSARSAGVPIEVISPCTMITASSATPRTVCANCSTTRIDTPSLRDVRDDLVQLLDDDRRQPHRQLVEQEQRRVGREPARHREHLLLAARQRARELRCAVRRGAGSARTRSPRSSRSDRPGERRHAEVLADGQVREDALAFGDEAEAGARELVGRGAVDAPAGDEQVAGGRRHQAARDLQRRRLPGAVRAEDRERPCPAGRRGRRRAPPRCGRTRP